MGFSKEWKKEEIDLLFSDLSNGEIAIRTGRSIEAVRTKRYVITGSHVEPARSGSKHNLISNVPPYQLATPEYKVLRIKDLAKRIGVRLEG